MLRRIVQRTLATHAEKPRFLITGGRGQLGRGMAKELSARHGEDSVILTDISYPTGYDLDLGYTACLDVTNYKDFRTVVAENRVTQIIHLPALLSATCEANLPLAMKVNIDTANSAMLIADEFKCKLFIPSSIGAFGPGSPLEAVPDKCIQDPLTFYGCSKIYAELMMGYMSKMRNNDFRCLRYPGIISPVAEPGGGTTDYAVDIYKQIVGESQDHFECYLAPDARLPMMLEEDCVTGTCDFLEVDASKLTSRVYNLGAIDFSPQEVAAELAKQYGEFDMIYNVDPLRQGIAENWPKVFLDDGARADWGWKPKYDSTAAMTKYMIENIPKNPNPVKKEKPAGDMGDSLLDQLKAMSVGEREALFSKL